MKKLVILNGVSGHRGRSGGVSFEQKLGTNLWTSGSDYFR